MKVFSKTSNFVVAIFFITFTGFPSLARDGFILQRDLDRDLTLAIGALRSHNNTFRKNLSLNIKNQLRENIIFWETRNVSSSAYYIIQLMSDDNIIPADLALSALILYQTKHYNHADETLSLLRKLEPNDHHIDDLANEGKLNAAQTIEIEIARSLARDSRKIDAVNHYNSAFPEKIPLSYAVEYYLVLGTSSTPGYELSTSKLLALADRWSEDSRFKLGYAQLLTYMDASRDKGIGLLQELSTIPSVAETSRQSWRLALLWQAGGTGALRQIDAYTSKFSTDPELTAKRADIDATLPDEALLARLNGYAALEENDTRLADAAFTKALSIDPSDTEAMVMLSNIRRTQNRLRESKILMLRALEIEPDRKEEFLIAFGIKTNNLDDLYKLLNTKLLPIKDDKNFILVSEHAIRKKLSDLLISKDLISAVRLLKLYILSNKNSPLVFELGLIQINSGDCTGAIQSFESAVTIIPDNNDIKFNLARSFLCGGSESRGLGLLGQLRQIHLKTGVPTDVDRIDRTVSEYIVSRTETTYSVSKQIRNFQTAIKIWHDSPWARLALARLYWETGRKSEAIILIKSNIGNSGGSGDNIEASIIFFSEIKDLVSAVNLASRVPDNQRTVFMKEIIQNNDVKMRIDILKKTFKGEILAEKLLQIAASSDPFGKRAIFIAQELMQAKKSDLVPRVFQSAIESTDRPSEAQRISYATFLLDHNFIVEGRKIVQSLREGTMSADGKTTLDKIERAQIPRYLKTISKKFGIKEAVRVGESYQGSDLDGVNLRVSLLQLHAQDGSAEESKQMVNDLIMKYPDDQGVWLTAIKLGLADDREGSIQMAARAAQKFGNSSDFLVEVAAYFKEAGMKREALSYYMRARSVRVATGH